MLTVSPWKTGMLVPLLQCPFSPSSSHQMGCLPSTPHRSTALRCAPSQRPVTARIALSCRARGQRVICLPLIPAPPLFDLHQRTDSATPYNPQLLELPPSQPRSLSRRRAAGYHLWAVRACAQFQRITITCSSDPIAKRRCTRKRGEYTYLRRSCLPLRQQHVYNEFLGFAPQRLGVQARKITTQPRPLRQAQRVDAYSSHLTRAFR